MIVKSLGINNRIAVLRIHRGWSGHSAQDSGCVLYTRQGTGHTRLRGYATFLAASNVCIFRAEFVLCYSSGFSCVGVFSLKVTVRDG